MDPVEKEYFTRAVYGIARLIPPGRATSYGAIARAAGHPELSRLAGRIMSHSGGDGVPAHRVVNSRGILTAAAAFGGAGRLERLLEAEGVEVRSGRICRWREVFWDPLAEIVPKE